MLFECRLNVPAAPPQGHRGYTAVHAFRPNVPTPFVDFRSRRADERGARTREPVSAQRQSQSQKTAAHLTGACCSVVRCAMERPVDRPPAASPVFSLAPLSGFDTVVIEVEKHV